MLHPFFSKKALKERLIVPRFNETCSNGSFLDKQGSMPTSEFLVILMFCFILNRSQESLLSISVWNSKSVPGSRWLSGSHIPYSLLNINAMGASTEIHLLQPLRLFRKCLNSAPPHAPLLKHAPYLINGSDCPGSPQAFQNLSKVEGDQKHLPQQIKHELVDSSGSEANSTLHLLKFGSRFSPGY